MTVVNSPFYSLFRITNLLFSISFVHSFHGWRLDFSIFDIFSLRQVPFLSAGEDIGERKVRYEGESEINGKFLVEEVKPGDGAIYRRLIFLSNENLVQSEVKLKQTSDRGMEC